MSILVKTMDNYNRKHWEHARARTHKTLWITIVFVAAAGTRISRKGGKWRGGKVIGAMLGVGRRHTPFWEKELEEKILAAQKTTTIGSQRRPHVLPKSQWLHTMACETQAPYIFFIFYFLLNSFMSIQFSHGFKLFFIWSQSFLISLQFNHEFHPICS